MNAILPRSGDKWRRIVLGSRTQSLPPPPATCQSSAVRSSNLTKLTHGCIEVLRHQRPQHFRPLAQPYAGRQDRNPLATTARPLTTAFAAIKKRHRLLSSICERCVSAGMKPSPFSWVCDVYGSNRGMQILSLPIFSRPPPLTAAMGTRLGSIPLSRIFGGKFLSSLWACCLDRHDMCHPQMWIRLHPLCQTNLNSARANSMAGSPCAKYTLAQPSMSFTVIWYHSVLKFVRIVDRM